MAGRTNKLVDDIRRIARTGVIEELLRRKDVVDDKKPINGSRSTAVATTETSGEVPCWASQSAEDGSFTCQEIIDAVSEPALVDGQYNTCDILNTITSCEEPTSNVDLILKPDGKLFDLTAGAPTFLWSSRAIIDGIQNDGDPWTYSSLEDALTATDAAKTVEYGADWSRVGTAYQITLAADTLDINGVAIGTEAGWDFDYVVYVQKYLIDDVGGDFYDYEYLFAVPCSYDLVDGDEFHYPKGAYQIDVDTPIPPPYFWDWDNITVEAGQTYESPFDCTATLQMYLDQADGKWYPDPDYVSPPIKWSYGVNTLDFEFGGGRTARVQPAKDGGFMLFETSAGNPTGYARIYRRDRTLAVVVPVAQIGFYQP